MLTLDDAVVGLPYRVKPEDSDGPWCEVVITRKYRDDDGMLRAEYRYFEGSPKLPEDAFLLDLERLYQ